MLYISFKMIHSGYKEGGCKKGLAEGHGTAKGDDTYIGEFKNGQEHGKGTKYFIAGFPDEMNGCFYNGTFRNGFPQGELDCSQKNNKEFWKKINNSTPNKKLIGATKD